MRPVAFAPQAAFELGDAAASYEATRPDLGREFLNEIHRTLMHVAVHPQIAPAIGGQFRRAVVHRFPYSIVYRLGAGEVQVIGILPTRADPRQLKQRLSLNPR